MLVATFMINDLFDTTSLPPLHVHNVIADKDLYVP